MKLPLITHRHREIQLSELRKNLTKYLQPGTSSPLAVYRHKEIAGFLLTPETYLSLLMCIAQVDDNQRIPDTPETRNAFQLKPNRIFAKPVFTHRWWPTSEKDLQLLSEARRSNTLHQIWTLLNGPLDAEGS